MKHLRHKDAIRFIKRIRSIDQEEIMLERVYQKNWSAKCSLKNDGEYIADTLKVKEIKLKLYYFIELSTFELWKSSSCNLLLDKTLSKAAKLLGKVHVEDWIERQDTETQNKYIFSLLTNSKTLDISELDCGDII